ncbi:MAG: hypothetical protein ABI995_16150, partial [Acidobacteriota bacterium]
CYLQPILLLPYFAWLLYETRAQFFSPRVLLLWITPLLVAIPWMIRNQIVLGTPAFIRDNLGIELYISFNDCTPAAFDQSGALHCIQSTHPNSALNEATAVRDLGEYRYNQSRLSIARTWIAGHPSAVISLIAQRTLLFWFPSHDGWPGYTLQRPRTWLLHILTLLSFFGLWFSLRTRISGAPLLAAFYIFFPPIYYNLLFVTRYRSPILWITWLLAASLAAKLFPAHRLVPVPPR